MLNKNTKTFSHSFIFLSFLLFTLIHLPSSLSLQINKGKHYYTFLLSPKTSYHPEVSLLSSSKFADISTRINEKKPAVQFLSKKITEYSGKVQIGNPPQELEMVFDTGSANIIVTSSFCNTTGCLNHKQYDMEKSNTHSPIFFLETHYADLIRTPNQRDQILMYFGTGQVKSYLGYDTICIADGKLCANNTLILEACEMSLVPFSHVSFDGIIGLGFTYLSVAPESNFLEMLYRQGKIDHLLFSFYFNKDDTRLSAVNIGGYDKKLFTGNIHYSKVHALNHYWEIDIEGIYYNDTEVIDCTTKKCGAVVDTGTSMLAAPFESFTTLSELLSVDINCVNLDTLKNLQFKINGKKFTLEPDYYVLKVESDTNTNCISALMQLDALSSNDKHIFILGLPFLKKYFTVYDREKKRIGFALANHNFIE